MSLGNKRYGNIDQFLPFHCKTWKGRLSSLSSPEDLRPTSPVRRNSHSPGSTSPMHMVPSPSVDLHSSIGGGIQDSQNKTCTHPKRLQMSLSKKQTLLPAPVGNGRPQRRSVKLRLRSESL
ncbi:hypothetical protein DPMN_038211 [Dreissena polymorpha]|uniref:Uncharacterized protein n=1 Tax=Dreissena polymorpha TaxID=45954 RepID=A0A9D4MF09_DREPO|nr:hypothetical protein DPMN_038211 [Dreissena polymorpha]